MLFCFWFLWAVADDVFGQTAPVTGEADLSEVYEELAEIKRRLDALEADRQEPDEPGEEPPPPPDGDSGFSEIDWSGSIDLPADATERQANDALAGNDKVRFAAGAEYDFALVLPRSTQLVGVHGEGDRPVFNAPPGSNGISIVSSRSDEVVIQGLSVRGPPLPHRGTSQGIRLRLNGQDGKHAKRVLIEDCEVTRFDTNIEMVDDWRRVRGEAFEPGRIHLTINRCIIHQAYGSDSHHVGVYLEGVEKAVIKDTIIDHSGWRPGFPGDRNKKSHNIYAQSFNGPVVIDGCVLSRAAANAVQLRAGGDILRTVMSQNALGPWLSHRAGRLEGCVLLDQVNIRDDAADQFRGHGYIPNAWHMTIKNNIAARRHGGLGNIPAFKGVSKTTTLEGNVAIAWHEDGLNFEVEGQLHRSIGTNRTLDALPGAGIPAFDEDEIGLRLERPRGVWGEKYTTAPFIQRCREAIQK